MAESEEAVSIQDDMDRIRQMIRAHIEDKDVRAMFWTLSAARCEVDEMMIIALTNILRKMNEKEKDRAVIEMIQMVQEAGAHRQEMERIVDKTFIYAREHDVLSANNCMEGLTSTADFTLKTKIDGKKFKYIRENLHDMDYKGVRAVFKKIIDVQMGRLPRELSVDQRRMMMPVENLLMYIMDRKSNVFPSLFAITELNRVPDKKLFIFPRLAAAATLLENSFRPLAEMAYIIGRCFLFPLPGHPAYPSSSPCWRIDHVTNMIFHRSMLPYRSELHMPQTYLFYMILRQPRGKDHLSSVFRQAQGVKMSLDEMVAVIISETMAQVEALPQEAEIPRYQWENIFHIFMYEISVNQINFCRVATLLTATLTKTGYRRGRDELMWIMLQYVGMWMTHLTKEQIEAVIELYRVLYSEDETWTGASDHPQTMVRFLASACMWIILTDSKDNLPTPHGSLAHQIEFIRQCSERAADDDAKLAVLANACAESEVYKRVVQPQLNHKIEGNINEEPFMLSYGKPACGKTASVSIEFIDSLTVKAKHQLFNLCIQHMRAPRSDQRLPSFAAVETCAKLMQMMEYEGPAKMVCAKLLPQTLHVVCSQPLQQVEGSRDQLHIYIELLCYRLAGLQPNALARQNLILSSLSAMGQPAILQCSQLYFAFEHLVMRQWTWVPFADCVTLCSNLLKPKSKMQQLFLNPFTFCTINPPSGDQTILSIAPEIVRLFLVNMLRTFKIVGAEIPSDVVVGICSSFPLPASQLFSLPAYVAEAHSGLGNMEEKLQSRLQDLGAAVHNDFIALQGLGEDRIQEHYTRPDRAPTFLCVIFRLLYEGHSGVSATFYNILDQMNPRELIQCTNALVDFVISQVSTLDKNQDFFAATVRVLNDMVFHWQVFSLDRLFMSLALHPTTDDHSQYALHIIKSIAAHCSGTHERIASYLQTVPPAFHPSSSEFAKKLVEYHKKYPEYTYSELANRAQQHAMMGGQIGDPGLPRTHLPVYYGSMVDRLLPVVDFVITRALELNVTEDVITSLLNSFAPLYKLHPSPITFVYSTLFCLHEQIGQNMRARQFAIAILQHGAVDSVDPLTPSFISYNHQKSSVPSIVSELVQRVVDASEFVLTPPDFVAKDWRFAEFSPASQALYLACIEILASPHPPRVITQTFVHLLCSSKLSRPYLTLNSIALILTALPLSYSSRIYDEIVAILDDGYLEDMSISQIGFENFEEGCLLGLNSRAVAVVALAQAHWLHSNLAGLSSMLNVFEKDLKGRMKSEKELLFVLRLLVPLLQRSYDARDRSRQIEDCLRLVGTIYDLIAEVSVKVDLQYEDTICDLLYHLKYMYVGDFVRGKAEEAIARMRPSLQAKLKFIIAGPPQVETRDKSEAEPKDISRLAAKVSMENKLMIDDKIKQKKFATWTDEECQIVYKIFSQNYEDYNRKLVGASKFGKTPRQKLFQSILDGLAAVNSDKTENHLKERIRYDLKKVRDAIATQKRNLNGTGGGSGEPVCQLPFYLQDIEQYLRREQSSIGVSGGLEVCGTTIVTAPPSQNSGEGLYQEPSDANLDCTTPMAVTVEPKGIKHFVPLIVSSPSRDTPTSMKRARLSRLTPEPINSLQNVRGKVLELQLEIEQTNKEYILLKHENEKKRSAILDLEEALLKKKIAIADNELNKQVYNPYAQL